MAKGGAAREESAQRKDSNQRKDSYKRMARGSDYQLLGFWKRGREKETLARCLRELERESESETEVTEGFTKHSLRESEARPESKESDSFEDNRVYEISEVGNREMNFTPFFF
ncbi:hypothetical protein CRG98_033811 [Punica granatum]|nr:hypothetical protein CRG98_033811 [Punica granatum]